MNEHERAVNYCFLRMKKEREDKRDRAVDACLREMGRLVTDTPESAGAFYRELIRLNPEEDSNFKILECMRTLAILSTVLGCICVFATLLLRAADC